MTFDLSPNTVKRERRQEKALLPQFHHLGNFILEKGAGKVALLEAATIGAPRPPALGRDGAPVGEEAGREGISTDSADDLLSEPKLVGTFSPLASFLARSCLPRRRFT